jgi:HK97 family phage prohead protease
MFKEVSKAANDPFKDIDIKKGEGVIAFATYGSKDRDGDRANQGMFSKSWNEFKDVRFFKNHDKTTGPGKIMKLWDDDKHAYSQVKFGTHTEGQDVLKQIDEGIITDASYVFVPMKGKPFAEGGYDYTEVFHKEVSALTHWGAHPESKVKTVKKSLDEFQKSYEAFFSPGDYVTPRPGKAHMSEHEGMRMIVAQSDYRFYSVIMPDGSMHKWYRSDELIPYDEPVSADMTMGTMKEAQARLDKLKSFIRNTTASDASIQEVLKEAEYIENLIKGSGSTQSSSSTLEQQKGAKEDEAMQLLNLQFLLQ